MRPNTAMPSTQLIPHDTTTMPSTTQEGLRADNTANTDPNVPLEAVGALPTTTTLWEAAVPALYPLRLASFLVQDVAGYPRTRSNRGLVGEMHPGGMQITRPSPSHSPCAVLAWLALSHLWDICNICVRQGLKRPQLMTHPSTKSASHPQRTLCPGPASISSSNCIHLFKLS